MKFFVDTADVKEIQELNDLGLVDGVTTKPVAHPEIGRQDIGCHQADLRHRQRPGLGGSHRAGL